MRRFPNLAILLLLLLGRLAACSVAKPPATGAIHLSAVLLSPTDIKLDWKDDQHVAGHIVEWATETNGNYIILAFARPEVTSFVHPNLAPQTKCCYRIRPYFGTASAPVEVTAGKAIANEKIADAAGSAGEKFSMRNVATINKAAPTDLKAGLVGSAGVRFTWTDHAADEEGFMLEIKTAADSDFHICAITGPGITSYGFAFAPPESKVQFRIRPFYYGAASNLAQQKTGFTAADANKSPR